jgi:hypothetical protein
MRKVMDQIDATINELVEDHIDLRKAFLGELVAIANVKMNGKVNGFLNLPLKIICHTTNVLARLNHAISHICPPLHTNQL